MCSLKPRLLLPKLTATSVLAKQSVVVQQDASHDAAELLRFQLLRDRNAARAHPRLHAIGRSFKLIYFKGITAALTSATTMLQNINVYICLALKRRFEEEFLPSDL